MPRILTLLAAALLPLGAAACRSGEADGPPPTLVIGGIPDQDVALLEERFGGLADYLSAGLAAPPSC